MSLKWTVQHRAKVFFTGNYVSVKDNYWSYQQFSALFHCRRIIHCAHCRRQTNNKSSCAWRVVSVRRRIDDSTHATWRHQWVIASQIELASYTPGHCMSSQMVDRLTIASGLDSYSRSRRHASFNTTPSSNNFLSSLPCKRNYSSICYPRESFREGLCNHRRWFVCLSVCFTVCYHDN